MMVREGERRLTADPTVQGMSRPIPLSVVDRAYLGGGVAQASVTTEALLKSGTGGPTIKEYDNAIQ